MKPKTIPRKQTTKPIIKRLFCAEVSSGIARSASLANRGVARRTEMIATTKAVKLDLFHIISSPLTIIGGQNIKNFA
jgi:hypothetical protein